jgi:tetratricopeptide (TPR) repeat protein
LHGEGLYEDAADAYERILKKVPASHRAWASLGDCYDKLGRKSDADEAYHHAIDLVERRIELEGESTGLNALLAHHWAHLRQFEKSRTYALKSLDSKNPEDQVTIAIAFSRAGDAHSARLAVDRALTAGYPETSIKEIDSLRRVLADRNDTGDQ